MKCPVCSMWNVPCDTWDDMSIAYMCTDCCAKYVVHPPYPGCEPEVSVDECDVVRFLLTCESSPHIVKQLQVPGVKNATFHFMEMFYQCLSNPEVSPEASAETHIMFELSMSVDPNIGPECKAELECMLGKDARRFSSISVIVRDLDYVPTRTMKP